MAYKIINTIAILLPEVIYFTLFLVYTKNYNVKKLLLFILLLIGYIILKFIFPLNIYFQIIFTLYVPIVLKFIYKNKFHVSDLFVFVYASISLIVISLITYPVSLIFNNYLLAYFLNRICMFLFIFLARKKLNKYYVWIIKQWNRNYEKPNRVKAITIRQICVISLNVMIYILYLGVVYNINIVGS